MLRILARTLALGLALPTLLSVAPARANLTLPTGFRDSTLYSGIGLPVAMAFLPGPPEKGWRLLITEQKGQRVSELVNGVPGPTPPFQQVSEVDWVAGERGCLSLAVDPRWPAQPYIYLHYTSFGAIHLVRYRMTGDLTFAHWTIHAERGPQEGIYVVAYSSDFNADLPTTVPPNEKHEHKTIRVGCGAIEIRPSCVEHLKTVVERVTQDSPWWPHPWLRSINWGSAATVNRSAMFKRFSPNQDRQAVDADLAGVDEETARRLGF